MGARLRQMRSDPLNPSGLPVLSPWRRLWAPPRSALGLKAWALPACCRGSLSRLRTPPQSLQLSSHKLRRGREQTRKLPGSLLPGEQCVRTVLGSDVVSCPQCGSQGSAFCGSRLCGYLVLLATCTSEHAWGEVGTGVAQGIPCALCRGCPVRRDTTAHQDCRRPVKFINDFLHVLSFVCRVSRDGAAKSLDTARPQ